MQNTFAILKVRNTQNVKKEKRKDNLTDMLNQSSSISKHHFKIDNESCKEVVTTLFRDDGYTYTHTYKPQTVAKCSLKTTHHHVGNVDSRGWGTSHLSADIICQYYDSLFSQILHPMTHFFTTIHTRWPFFFQNFNVKFQICTYFKTFVNFQLKEANFHSKLTKFTPNDLLF